MLKTEQLCTTRYFENGANAMWSGGNSPLVRMGDRIFCTDSQPVPGRAKLSCTSMRLFEKRGDEAWEIVYEDEGVFQREPCPVLLAGTKLLVTANPTARLYAPDEPSMYVPCTPMLYVFDVSGDVRLEKKMPMPWDTAKYPFIDHSYRGGAVDAVTGDMYFDNMISLPDNDERHVWALMDKELRAVFVRNLVFPKRGCYHNIAMRGGEAYVFAVQDMIESNAEWKAYKRQVTGNEWDYDFRIIYMNYTPDVRNQDFSPTVRVCDRDSTCGWTRNLDCCYTKDGDMLLLVSVRNVAKKFMRDRFFPEEKMYSRLEVYRFSHGTMQEMFVVDENSEESGKEVQYTGFFHTAADDSVHLIWDKSDNGETGQRASGTYIMSLGTRESRYLCDQSGWLFGSKTRLGAAPEDRVDILWVTDSEIRYADLRLQEVYADE